MATKYDIVPTSKDVEDGYHGVSRRDDSGPWNSLQAWYLFLLHQAASIVFVAYLIQWIDGHHFQTGSPSSIFQTNSPLYQTQINGLVSLALVMIRLLASACTALLVWRMIFILLEKQGMTLAELTRMNNHRIPILPRLKTRSQLLWSGWAILLAFFLWPPNFAAPLANASLAWSPSAKVSSSSTSIVMSTLGNASDLQPVPDRVWRTTSLLNAAVLTGTDPGYAFNNITGHTGHPLRRYFKPSVNITDNSRISTTLPYANFQVKWHEAGDGNFSERLMNTTFTDFVDPSPGAEYVSVFKGSVTLVREDPYEPNDPFDPPEESKVFMSSRLVAVLVSSQDDGPLLSNGSSPGADIPCTSISPYLGTLPGPAQHKLLYQSGWVDCYQIGTVTAAAGIYAATDCNILSAGSFAELATCMITQDATNIKGDLIAPVAFEMMSEIMKETLMLNYTHQYMREGLDAFTTGMLTLAYHAAWSSVMDTLGKSNETAALRMAEPMVQAGVSRGKLYVWLAMNLSLLVAAVLMYVALSFSSVKAIRDITLTPLMADFSAITNCRRGVGLRDAATLSRKDRKLPRIKLTADGTYNFVDEIGFQT